VLDTIQGLWIGDKLSTMEQLSIKSYMANGHPFVLYTYAPLEGVPDGVVIRDGNEIVPESHIKRFNCLAQFSNFFCYALLNKGGWFVDLDNVCLKPYDFPEEYVFYRDTDYTTITFAVAKSPANSPLMQYCYNLIDHMNQTELDAAPYQALGPDLMRIAVPLFGLDQFAKPGYVFDPIRWNRTPELVNPNAKWNLARAHSMHLFHGAWNKGHEAGAMADTNKLDTDGTYPEGCLYEILKRRYL
jgi:hypothetical protein